MSLDKDALDRHITGNYGEDQFKTSYESDNEFEDNVRCFVVCKNCKHPSGWHLKKKCSCGCKNFERSLITISEAKKLGVYLSF